MPNYSVASQTPLVLADNVFDAVTCYPAAVLTATSSAAGRPPDAVADYRRDRTWWQGANEGTAGNGSGYVTADHGAGRTVAYDTLFLDRGHNAWGLSVFVSAFNASNTLFSSTSRAVPALDAAGRYTPGGNPATAVCVTEEGALWCTVSAVTGAQMVAVGLSYATGVRPVFTGLIVGRRVSLSMYPTTIDDDARTRTEATATSTALWSAADTTYTRRTLRLPLTLIGDAEYDGAVRGLRALVFDRAQPALVVVDAGRYPERAGLWQYDGTTWAAEKGRAYRSTTLPFHELNPALPGTLNPVNG